MEKTLEQLRAEAEAAQQLLADAERAERAAKEERERAERQARYEEQQRIERAKRQAVSDRVLTALVDAGISNQGIALVNVEYAYQKVSSYRSVPAGYVITVRTHSGPARRFPVKANGSFNTPKIVEAVKHYLDVARAAEEREAQRKAQLLNGVEIAARLNAEFPSKRASATVSYYLPMGGGRTEHREVIASPGKVFVQFGNLDCTEEQARIMLEAYARAFPKAN